MNHSADFTLSLGEHRSYLLRYAEFHLRDAALAEDAVQDALTAALAQAERFEGRSQLRTWLTGILKHKIVDILRNRARGLPADAAVLGEQASVADDAFRDDGHWIDPPAAWGAPDAALEARQFWAVYEQCCERLSRRDALVYSMREVMGLSSEEICKNMGITTTNLHVILFRARTSLRACMDLNWFGRRGMGDG